MELVMMDDFLRMNPGSDFVMFLTDSRVPYQVFLAALSTARIVTLLQCLPNSIWQVLGQDVVVRIAQDYVVGVAPVGWVPATYGYFEHSLHDVGPSPQQRTTDAITTVYTTVICYLILFYIFLYFLANNQDSLYYSYGTPDTRRFPPASLLAHRRYICASVDPSNTSLGLDITSSLKLTFSMPLYFAYRLPYM